MKRIAAISGLAALLAIGLVAVAGAHTVAHDSRVTLQHRANGPSPDHFQGRVVSQREPCQRERTVRILRRVSEEENEFVARTTTDAQGAYDKALDGGADPGTYYAVAARKVLRDSARHKHVCKRAVSRDVIVPSTGP